MERVNQRRLFELMIGQSRLGTDQPVGNCMNLIISADTAKSWESSEENTSRTQGVLREALDRNSREFRSPRSGRASLANLQRRMQLRWLINVWHPQARG